MTALAQSDTATGNKAILNYELGVVLGYTCDLELFSYELLWM